MKNGKLMVAPAMLWLSIFFVIPLLIVVAVSFAGRTPYGQIIFEFTLKNYLRFLEPLYLQIFADTGVVVDMISQSAPHGTTMDFSFTASSSDLPLVMKAISAANLDKDAKAAPLISVGYSKLNLFGEEMVTSCGVAARALNALAMTGIEVLLITTSDLDISLLVRAENEDAAYEALKKAYEL